MPQIDSVRRTDIADRAASSPFEIVVFDTAVGSQNLGDEIIMRSARRVLRELFPQAHLWALPTHDTFGAAGRKRLRHSLFSIACGTNLIHADMPGKGLWKLPIGVQHAPMNIGRYLPRNLAMMAVGSNAQPLSSAASSFLNKSLWKGVPVSARDMATEKLLTGAGVAATHTGCVTMWDLPENHTATIRKEKAEAAVVCLTGTRRAARAYVERDTRFLDAVANSYGKRYLWPQGQVDLEYYLALGRSDFEILPHSLEAYEDLLRSGLQLDFVGSRLHAGIFAMMHGCRPLVIKIDNRAADIGDSVGLPTLASVDMDALPGLIAASRATQINLPRAAITDWKNALVTRVEESLSADIDLKAFRGR